MVIRFIIQYKEEVHITYECDYYIIPYSSVYIIAIATTCVTTIMDAEWMLLLLLMLLLMMRYLISQWYAMIAIEFYTLTIVHTMTDNQHSNKRQDRMSISILWNTCIYTAPLMHIYTLYYIIYYHILYVISRRSPSSISNHMNMNICAIIIIIRSLTPFLLFQRRVDGMNKEEEEESNRTRSYIYYLHVWHRLVMCMCIHSYI